MKIINPLALVFIFSLSSAASFADSSCFIGCLFGGCGASGSVSASCSCSFGVPICEGDDGINYTPYFGDPTTQTALEQTIMQFEGARDENIRPFSGHYEGILAAIESRNIDRFESAAEQFVREFENSDLETRNAAYRQLAVVYDRTCNVRR